MGKINIRDQKRDDAICEEYLQLKYGDSTLAIRQKYDISSSRLIQILERNGIKRQIGLNTKSKGVNK